MPGKIDLTIIYNGISRTLSAQPHEQVQALLLRAIHEFGISSNPHLLSLFREDRTKVEEAQSVEAAGLTDGQELLLRPDAVKGGSSC